MYKYLNSRYAGLFAAVYTAVMLLSLKYRFLDIFMPGTWHGRLGFDFFSIPRSFINLTNGTSLYFTRACDYGPYASWFPYHPAVSVAVGSWLSLFGPWLAYSVFVVLSLGVLVYCARLMARQAADEADKGWLWVLFLCSPVVYLMLWAGQLHVLVVLAVTLVLADLLELERQGAGTAGLRPKLMAGILISLFSKPIILPVLFALFAVRPYRRTILLAGGVYAVVSVLFLVVPWLNPASVGLDRLIDVLRNPSHLFRAEIYRGVPIVSYRPEFASDNIIHWLNMKMRSGVAEPFNFEVFSLPAFFGGLFGNVTGWIAKVPVALSVLLVLPAYLIKDGRAALRVALWGCVMLVLSFFLSYEVVYEYHYTVVLALIAMAFVRYKSARGFERSALLWFCGAGALLYIPTPYFMFRHAELVHHTANAAAFKDPFISIVLGENIYGWALVWIRSFRGLPVFVMYAAAAALAAESTISCLRRSRELRD